MFSHLHLHTEFSLLNGAIRISQAIAKAKELGMPAVAMTDYGNLFGAVEFFSTAKKEGIRPVIGAELFLPSYDDHTVKTYKRSQDFYWQVVLLVKNKKGYQNLCKLVTQSYLEGFYYKPRIDTKLLAEHSEGLIALSSGFNSEINHHLFHEKRDLAVEAAKKYASLFPGEYYIELQDNGLDNQRAINGELVSIANEVGLPLVASNNVHYINPDDAAAFEVLRSVQLSRTVAAPYDQMKFSTNGYYFKSAEEMERTFDFCPEAISNIPDIVEKCEYEFTFGKYHLPKYETPQNKSLDDYLEEVTFAGLAEQWESIKEASHVTDDDLEKYHERLRLEIDVINKMGFAGYFLIVSDFIKWAKEHGIPVGPGRGSGAGSLVAYSLKITALDPLPYNLLFERFLNPERVSMPDFDIDFCQDRRSEVIEYVNEKYGNVCQIITFGKMKAKAVIRDVGRVMGLEYEFVDKIAKLIPNELNITLTKALEDEPDLQDLYDDDDTVNKLIDTSLRLEGLSRHASVHAAGVIITDQPLWQLAPLYKGSQDDIVVQYDMKNAEKIGLIKFDFLGLKTLTVIQKAVQNVKKSKDIDIDILSVSVADPKVFENLSKGDGCGIFQLESSGMQDLMKRLKPTLFEDIIALVALYRPGPMDLIPDFIERKHGRQKVDCLDPRLESILGPTYGIMVYQEQVMQIAQILGGYSLGGADLLRRAMGKKNVEEMDRQRTIFKEGAKKNGLTEERADHIFDLMAKFAGYGFNKSHAAAYALISFQTAWLKTYHPTEYMAAIMSTELEDTDKLLLFMGDAKEHDISFLPPDINVSEREFTVVEDGKIRYALGALKGVGTAAIESMVEARKSGPFKSLYDFCMRVDLRRVSKKVNEVLVKAGAFDCFELPRKGMLEAIPRIVDLANKQQKDIEIGQSNLFGSMDVDASLPSGVQIDTHDDNSKNEKLALEKEVFGFYFSGHPLEVYQGNLQKLTTHRIDELKKARSEEEVVLGGTLISQRTILTKKGDKMSFGLLEDLGGKLEIIVFPRTYKTCHELLSSDVPLIVKGKVDRTAEGDKIIVSELQKLTDNLEQTTRSIHLEIPYQNFTQPKVKRAVEILSQYQGKSQIYIHLKKESSFEAVIEFPGKYSALACEPLQHRLHQLFEGSTVKFL
jgi:DNA polymerase III subunit alpha